MIFAVEKLKNHMLVHVFNDLNDLVELSNCLEWQDVFGGAYRIIDTSGVLYQWDKSKRSAEYATLYGYSLEAIGEDKELAQQCLKQYAIEQPREFRL